METSTDVPPAGETETAAPAGPASASIERIHRLERLERERLEEKQRREQRRQDRIAGVKPSGGRHDVVDRIEDVTKYPMLVLGIAWLVVLIVVGTIDLNGSSSVVLVGTLFVLWVVLLVEYLVRLVISPDSRGYLRRRWVEPATVVVPPLEGWHLVGIEKVSLAGARGRASRSRPSSSTTACSASSSRRRRPCSWGPGWCCCSRTTPRAATSTATPARCGGPWSR